MLSYIYFYSRRQCVVDKFVGSDELNDKYFATRFENRIPQDVDMMIEDVQMNVDGWFENHMLGHYSAIGERTDYKPHMRAVRAHDEIAKLNRKHMCVPYIRKVLN